MNNTKKKLRLNTPLIKDVDTQCFDVPDSVLNHYLEHKFDLLGSNWTFVGYPTVAQGLERYHYNHSLDSPKIYKINRNAASLIDPSFKPIDWHIDFKSGYRWSDRTHFSKIPFGHLPGVDIKVPWELSRCQHLPQLALAHLKTKNTQYYNEIKNQILDFIIQNPVNFGVNWTCAMEVAIRSCNWILSYDLLLQSNIKMDPHFSEILKDSLYEHAQYILKNLEWSPQHRSNHYLSDLCGLIIIGLRLKSHPTVDTWLQFSILSFLQELDIQFYNDGCSFEASTGYHRLSSEITFYTIAAIVGAPQKRLHKIFSSPKKSFVPGFSFYELNMQSPLSDSQISKLNKMIHFLNSIKIGNQFLQIGDYDSGRLIKPQPDFTGGRENLQNLNSSILMGEALFENSSRDHIIFQIIKSLSKNTFLSSRNKVINFNFTKNKSVQEFKDKFKYYPSSKKQEFFLKFETDVLPLQNHYYPDFGLYILRNDQLFISFRCGPIGLQGLGSHAHNDQLSISIFYNNKWLIYDPGTYIYTPLVERRNHYRSVSSHFAPQLPDLEPEDLHLNVFSMSNRSHSQILRISKDELLGVHYGYQSPIYRRVTINKQKLIIQDLYTGDGALLQNNPSDLSKFKNTVAFSPSYGRIDPPINSST